MVVVTDRNFPPIAKQEMKNKPAACIFSFVLLRKINLENHAYALPELKSCNAAKQQGSKAAMHQGSKGARQQRKR